MRKNIIERLRCPECRSSAPIRLEIFQEDTTDQVVVLGLLICEECRHWYPIENRVLEFLTKDMCYVSDRKRFISRYKAKLINLGLDLSLPPEASDPDPRRDQQSHFDWYAQNDLQTYEEYEGSKFWRASDKLIIKQWAQFIPDDVWLLDVRCAQGRSTFNFTHLNINIVAFDISKRMIEKASDKYSIEKPDANVTFFVGDASKFPLRASTFDRVVLYGVLHHVPDPGLVCGEIFRVLKNGGRYLGHENNKSAFRRIFDWLQKLEPQWHEEAGEEPLISASMVEGWFPEQNVTVDVKTSVFVPPHLINWLPRSVGNRLMAVTDRIGQSVPWLRDQGGLIIFEMSKL